MKGVLLAFILKSQNFQAILSNLEYFCTLKWWDISVECSPVCSSPCVSLAPPQSSCSHFCISGRSLSPWPRSGSASAPLDFLFDADRKELLGIFEVSARLISAWAHLEDTEEAPSSAGEPEVSDLHTEPRFFQPGSHQNLEDYSDLRSKTSFERNINRDFYAGVVIWWRIWATRKKQTKWVKSQRWEKSNVANVLNLTFRE